MSQLYFPFTWYWRIVLKIILVYKSSFGEERGRFFVILNSELICDCHTIKLNQLSYLLSPWISKNSIFLFLVCLFFADENKYQLRCPWFVIENFFSGILQIPNHWTYFQKFSHWLCVHGKKVGNKILGPGLNNFRSLKMKP